MKKEIGISMELVSSLKSALKCSVLTLDPIKHSGLTAVDYMAPQTITDCGNLDTGLQANCILFLYILVSGSGTLFLNEMQKKNQEQHQKHITWAKEKKTGHSCSKLVYLIQNRFVCSESILQHQSVCLMVSSL